MINALGTGIGEDFNVEKLRYHKILIMCDADVDGSHIRTLILTFFYRQMHQLIEKGYIYIAQPPLYKIKRGKREEYIDTEAQMNQMLLEMGSEEWSLVQVKDKEKFEEKKLLDVLNVLVDINSLASGISKRGVELPDYIDNIDKKTKKLPKYRIKVEDESQFLYNDDELSEVIKKYEKKVGKEIDLSELEKDRKQHVIAHHLDRVEFFEADDLADGIKQLTKLGLDIEDYSPVVVKKEGTSKRGALYKFEKKDATPIYFDSLAEVLKFVQEEGKRGMSIQRYKGLGEMNPAQLWETTMDPARRTVLQVTLEDVVEADKTFTTLMGDEVEPRREFIQKYAREVRNLDI
jgi:DNA gyrase subunit B